MDKQYVMSQIGRMSPERIREWVGEGENREWALPIADRLAVSGYVTLADLTDYDLMDAIAA